VQKDHLEIILELEDTRGKFDLVLEGHAALDGKIELNSVKIEALNEKIDLVEQRPTKRIDSENQKLAERIDSLEQNLTRKIDTVAEISGGIAGMPRPIRSSGACHEKAM